MEEKVSYQYLRTFGHSTYDREKRSFRLSSVPVVTICYIRDDEKTKVGVSVCGPKDNFNYKRGKGLAYSRATRAGIKEAAERPSHSIEYRLIEDTKHYMWRREGKLVKDFTFNSFVVEDPKYLVTEKLDV